MFSNLRFVEEKMYFYISNNHAMFFNNLIFSKQCKPMVWCFDYNFKNGLVDHYVADITTALDSAKCCFETYPYKVQNLHWLIPILKSLEFDKNELLRIHNRYYYPFGVTMKARDFTSNVSRFGFNGNACPPYWRKKDEEIETMDFGARLLDGDLGLWLACDPLAAKYPSLSPYCFVGNMPIIAIDPDGKKIVIIGTPQEIAKFEAALALMASTPYGAQMVERMVNSKNNFVFFNYDESAFYGGIYQGKGVTNYYIGIFLNNPNEFDDGLRNTVTTFTHESKHALNQEEFDAGISNQNPAELVFRDLIRPFVEDKEGQPFVNTICVDDYSAVEAENFVRGSLEYPLRETYGGTPVMNKSISSKLITKTHIPTNWQKSFRYMLDSKDNIDFTKELISYINRALKLYQQVKSSEKDATLYSPKKGELSSHLKPNFNGKKSCGV